MAKKVCLVLSGCGYLDGAEIHESVLTMYFLEKEGIDYDCFAPDKTQMHVVDHREETPTEETRNVLTEAARIARGKVAPLADAQMSTFDALVIPGGFGAAKNLSTFASEGPRCTVDPDLQRLVGEAVAHEKPILAMCIAPAVLAAALRANDVGGAKLTIGNDAGTASAITQCGSEHVECPVEEARIDEAKRIITTPAYMYDATPATAGAGIEQAVHTLSGWLK